MGGKSLEEILKKIEADRQQKLLNERVEEDRLYKEKEKQSKYIREQRRMFESIAPSSSSSAAGAGAGGSKRVIPDATIALTFNNIISLDESNIGSASLLLTVTNDTFIDGISDANFELIDVPIGLTIGSIISVDSNNVNVLLAFDNTDFDDGIFSLTIKALGSGLNRGLELTTDTVTITALVESVLLSTVSVVTLTEANLDGVVIRLTLTGETFVEVVSSSNYTLNNAPTGLAIDSIERVSDTVLDITLSFDDTDFDLDIDSFSIDISGIELSRGNTLVSSEIVITAIDEPAPSFAFNPSLVNFSDTIVGNVSSGTMLLVTGANLTGNVTIPSTIGFRFSLTDNGGSTSPLELVQTDGVISTTIYVYFEPVSSGSAFGSASIIGGGANATLILVGIGLDPLLLNNFSGAVIALSLDRLSASYAGSAIRVRRSSDNTELDIGFANNILDTTALLSFAGTGNAFIRKWYNQTGSGLDFVQTDTSSQPKIVNTGVLVEKNGKPALDFTGTTPHLILASTAFASMVFDIYSIASLDSSIVSPLLSIQTPSISWGFSGMRAEVQSSGSSLIDNFIPVGDSIQKLFNLYVSSGNAEATVNDSSIFSQSGTPATITAGTRTLRIGRSPAASYINGLIQEIVVYNGNQVANKSGIKADLSDRYSIGTDIVTLLPYTEAFGANGLDGQLQYNMPNNFVISSDNGNEMAILDPANAEIQECDILNSSANQAFFFYNANGVQNFAITPPHSTRNKTNITLSWNVLRSASAPSVTVDWSIDGSVWNNISYSEPTDDAIWYAVTPIILPTGVENKHILYIRFGQSSDSSGSFTVLDDISITGT